MRKSTTKTKFDNKSCFVIILFITVLFSIFPVLGDDANTTDGALVEISGGPWGPTPDELGDASLDQYVDATLLPVCNIYNTIGPNIWSAYWNSFYPTMVNQPTIPETYISFPYPVAGNMPRPEPYDPNQFFGYVHETDMVEPFYVANPDPIVYRTAPVVPTQTAPTTGDTGTTNSQQQWADYLEWQISQGSQYTQPGLIQSVEGMNQNIDWGYYQSTNQINPDLSKKLVTVQHSL